MLVKCKEVPDEGFAALLEQRVMLFGVNYIYAGKLVGVNDTFVKLEDAHIVYETGPFAEKGYKDAQRLPGDAFYVQRALIESFGPGK